MNKKIIITIIAIICIAIIAIFAINKVKANDVNYKIAQVENYNYFKYHSDEKVGVIDRNGNTVIGARFDDIIIPNPEKDIFICYSQNTRTILNASNERLFEKYDDVEPIELKNIVSILGYEKSVLKYKKDEKYGLVDFQGNETVKNIYDSIENLQGAEGKFLVSKEGKYGVINLNGTVLVNCEYDSIKSDGYYSENTKYINSGFITAVKTSEGYRYGYIEYNGNETLKAEYNSIDRVPDKEEVYLIASKDGRYGLYKGSKEIIATEYQDISYCENGALIIQKNKNYGIATLDGKIVVDTKYANIESKGIYLYAQNANENIVFDVNGEKTDINYNKVVYETESEEYRIFTFMNNNVIYYGIENKNGVTVVQPSYSYIEYAYNDYFVAKDESGNLGVINANGKVLLDFKYDTLQKIKGKNILQAIATKSDETEIYSSKLENVCTIKNAKVDNENGYIAVFNDEETYYFDNNGNKLEESSETLKNVKLKNFPETIGNYKKVQASLDNIYYEI